VIDVLKTNISDVHGNYSKETFVGTIGGQLNQLYYIVEEIEKKFPHGLKVYMEKQLEQENPDKEYFDRPNNLRELILKEHFISFFMQYLKDGMQNDSIDIQLHKLCANYLDNLECPHDDLSELTDEQLIEFKELLKKHKPATIREASKNMDLIIDACLDVLSKRVSVEGLSIKIDQIHSKIRLCPLPEEICEEDFTEIAKKTIEGTEETKEEQVEHKANVEM
jgi:hypothetical protein